MFKIVLYYLHSTLVLSVYIDVVLTLSIPCENILITSDVHLDMFGPAARCLVESRKISVNRGKLGQSGS